MSDQTKTDAAKVDDQATEESAATTEAKQTDEAKSTDWKAEARKWEARAKENAKAAEELQRIKDSQLTEAERLQKRAEVAEARVLQLESEAELASLALTISEETGAPLKLLKTCTDEGVMREMAREWAAQAQTVHAGTTAAVTKLVKPTAAKQSAASAIADYFIERFN